MLLIVDKHDLISIICNLWILEINIHEVLSGHRHILSRLRIRDRLRQGNFNGHGILIITIQHHLLDCVLILWLLLLILNLIFDFIILWRQIIDKFSLRQWMGQYQILHKILSLHWLLVIIDHERILSRACRVKGYQSFNQQFCVTLQLIEVHWLHADTLDSLSLVLTILMSLLRVRRTINFNLYDICVRRRSSLSLSTSCRFLMLDFLRYRSSRDGCWWLANWLTGNSSWSLRNWWERDSAKIFRS